MGAGGVSDGPDTSQQPTEQGHGRTRCQPGTLMQRLLPRALQRILDLATCGRSAATSGHSRPASPASPASICPASAAVIHQRTEAKRSATMALYAEQAELRGEHVSAFALATGQVPGRTAGDVLATAAAMADIEDRRAEARARREENGPVDYCFGLPAATRAETAEGREIRNAVLAAVRPPLKRHRPRHRTRPGGCGRPPGNTRYRGGAPGQHSTGTGFTEVARSGGKATLPAAAPHAPRRVELALTRGGGELPASLPRGP